MLEVLLENFSKCTACGRKIESGQKIYCYECHDDIAGSVEETENEIKRMYNELAIKDEMIAMQAERIQKLQDKILQYEIVFDYKAHELEEACNG